MLTAPIVESNAVFDFPNGRISIGKADLVAIQKAVIAYLKQSKEEFKDSFIEELTHATARIDANGTGRIGTWLLEKHGEGLRLIRHPERSAVMYLFYATLTHSSGHWRVTHFDHERIVAR